MLILVDLVVVLFAWGVCILVNRRVNLDLECNTKDILKSRVEYKSDEIDYKLRGLTERGMKPVREYYLFSKGAKYQVSQELYDSLELNDEFYVHFAKYSSTVLAITKEATANR